jgi:hypothetical protein
MPVTAIERAFPFQGFDIHGIAGTLEDVTVLMQQLTGWMWTAFPS